MNDESFTFTDYTWESTDNEESYMLNEFWEFCGEQVVPGYIYYMNEEQQK